MPISLISNGPINEKEWQKWKDACNDHNKPQLSMHDCESAQERIKKASSYALQTILSWKRLQHKESSPLVLIERRTIIKRPL